jgi:hypothetical protein
MYNNKTGEISVRLRLYCGTEGYQTSTIDMLGSLCLLYSISAAFFQSLSLEASLAEYERALMCSLYLRARR